MGARRITASVELTADEIAQLAAPWNGAGFEVLLYGRPEGMNLEHCVLSAAFDRVPTTCRDLCVQRHANVELTDPTGYSFPVATDAACRNRLLHSRPVDGSQYLGRLWRSGLRSYRAVFNVRGDRVGLVVTASRLRSYIQPGTGPSQAAKIAAARNINAAPRMSMRCRPARLMIRASCFCVSSPAKVSATEITNKQRKARKMIPSLR